MRLRSEININLKFGLNVSGEPCELRGVYEMEQGLDEVHIFIQPPPSVTNYDFEQAKRRMVTSTQTEELAIHPFLEKFLAEAEPGACAPRREEDV